MTVISHQSGRTEVFWMRGEVSSRASRESSCNQLALLGKVDKRFELRDNQEVLSAKIVKSWNLYEKALLYHAMYGKMLKDSVSCDSKLHILYIK